MTELDQTLAQPYDDALRAPVFGDRNPRVVELHDMHEESRLRGRFDYGLARRGDPPGGSAPVSSTCAYVRAYASAITM